MLFWLILSVDVLMHQSRGLSVSALSLLGGGILWDEEMWDVRAKPSQPRAPSRDLGLAAATRPAVS